MQNPYAYSGTSSAEPPQDQSGSDYEAAVGPNSGYYIPRFEAFDNGGSRIGWHWPAFFVTSFWFIYRKMWVPGVLNLLYPWVMLIVLSVVTALTADSIKAHPGVFLLVFWLILAAPSFLLPMFANAMYWRHVRKLIDQMPASVASVPEKRIARLERDGRTGAGAMAAALAVFAFVFIGIMGILAAIAIPAYQDYSVRAQITEGLNLASMAKAGVTEYWIQHEAWPEQSDLMESIPSGMYTQSVLVEGGSVIITYGLAANSNISGKRLALQPGLTEQGEVVWTCGNAPVPAGVQPAGGAKGTEIPNKYLPRACRPPS